MSLTDTERINAEVIPEHEETGSTVVLADSLGLELAAEAVTAQIVVKLEENSSKVDDTDVCERGKQIQTEYRQDSHDHEPISVLSTSNGAFGYDVSSNKLKKVRLFKESEAQSWNEEAWALEQINKSGVIESFLSYSFGKGNQNRFLENMYIHLPDPYMVHRKSLEDP